MIDTHQHFWVYVRSEYGWIDETMTPLRRNFLPGDVKQEMARAGVAASVAVQVRQSLEETRWLLELANAHSFVAGVVGWVDLQGGDVDAQLERLAAHPKFIGVRHIVQAEPSGFLDRPRFREGVARLERHGLTYDILVYAPQLQEAVSFARAFPRQPFVLDHLGKPDIRGNGFSEWRRHFARMAELPNVCCKLSGLVTEADWTSWTPAQLRPYLDAALEAFGPSRLMIGSDWPVCLLAARYDAVVALVRDALAEFSEDEQAQVLGGTAREFYRLGVGRTFRCAGDGAAEAAPDTTDKEI
jgi:L-fuconolactonase